MSLNWVHKNRVAQVNDIVGALTTGFDRFVIDDQMAFAPQAAGSYAAGDNPFYSIDGTNAADGDATLDAGGGYKLTVTTTGDDEVAVLLNTNQSAFLPGVTSQPAYLALVEADADDITELQYLVGLGSDDDGDDAFDGGDGELDPNAAGVDTLAAFSFDTDDGDSTWQIDMIDDGGSLTSVGTGVAMEAGAKYLIAVWFNEENKPNFFIQKDGDEPVQYLHDTAFSGTGNKIGPVAGVSILSTATRDLFLRKHVFAADFGG